MIKSSIILVIQIVVMFTYTHSCSRRLCFKFSILYTWTYYKVLIFCYESAVWLLACVYFSHRWTHSRQFSSQTAGYHLSCLTMEISLGRLALSLEEILQAVWEVPQLGWVMSTLSSIGGIITIIRLPDEGTNALLISQENYCHYTKIYHF